MKRWFLWIIPILAAMLLPLLGRAANDFYTHGSFPSAGSPATSASMRAELDAISAGFDKLPGLTGNGNKVVLVNAGGTALTLGQQLIMGGNLTISGAFATTITVTGTTTITFPTSGTLATLAGTETLTNKTFALGSNTFSGTTAQFNAALSDNDLATLAGTETLTNKTLTSPTVTGGTFSSPAITTPTGIVAADIGNVTAFARTVLDDADAATARTTLDVPSNAAAVLDSLIDAKGDLLAGSANDTVVRVPVGVNGKVLVADSSEIGGVGYVFRAMPGWAVFGNNSRNNSTTPTTQYDLTCSDVEFWEPTSGNTYFKRAVSTVTVNTATAGPAANGRDQAGAFSANSWLYFYWIYNPGTDTVAGTVSTATTSTGPTLPSGYTAWAYSGAVRFNGSSNLVPTRMAGNWRQYEAEQSALTAGTATTETAVDLTALVPPTASQFRMGGSMMIQSTLGHVKLRAVTGVDTRLVHAFAASGETNTSGWGDVTLPNISQQFYYLWSSAITARSFDAWVYGYEEVLSRG